MTPSIQPQSQRPGAVGIALPPRPVIFEIDAWLWLRELSGQYGRRVTLADVPDEAWDSVGVPDAVWLMGVWERSPAGRAIAMNHPDLRRTFDAALPDWTPDDLESSPYCVRRYVVDAALGGAEGLAAARAALARRGIGLILDYVPNHVAPDHPWVTAHPEYFIHGTPEDLAAAPDVFFAAGDRVLAHGREPSAPPWPDVVQLNAFKPGLRAAAIATLIDIADQCDTICCDMVMLLTTPAFVGTWGERAGAPPEEEYWRVVLPAVRAARPHVRFIGEVYWDMEWEMQQQGFDYCYDKRLYDRLVHETAEAVRGHLLADLPYQERLVRFIETHDDPRAAAVFPGNRALAAAIAAYTLPGAKLFHQGQFEGLTIRLPVFLTRRPSEPVDRALQMFYRRLATAVKSRPLREGQWRLCALNGWPDNTSYNNLAAWCWAAGDERRVVVVNLSPHTSQARVQLPWPDLAGQNWVLEDIMEERLFERSGDEILNMGLFVELAPWGRHLFAIR